MRVAAFAAALLPAVALGDTGGPCSCTGDNSGIPEGHPMKDSPVGTYCWPWDLDTDVCRVGTDSYHPHNEEWCRNSWCYVQEDCWITFEGKNYTSLLTVYHGDQNEEVDLFWSYETCGFPNYYSGSWNWTFEACPRRRSNDVYFLIDSSGSVLESRGKQKPLWTYIQENVAHFIDGMHTTNMTACEMDSKMCGDRAGIILFGGTGSNTEDEDVRLVSSLTYDLTSLFTTAQSMPALTVPGNDKATHHTWTLTGIQETLKAWELDDDYNHNKILILLTDGKPNPPGNKEQDPGTPNQNPCDTTNGNHAIVDVLREMGIRTVVYTLKKEFDTLNCLVQNVDKDVINVPDPENFFDKVDHGFFCTSQITDGPTMSPSDMPTGAPTTMMPTPAPTNKPSNTPTKSPSDYPSPMPSYVPSMDPTQTPTNRPSRDPTYMPTKYPTDMPSPMPTNEPTNAPTPAPSPEPTPMPTARPTKMPTPMPSARPTEMPLTGSPTECKVHEVKKPLKNLKGYKGKGQCGKKKKKRCNSCEDCTWADIVCLDKMSGGEVCAHIVTEATCMDLKNCNWKNNKCNQVNPNTSGRRWRDTMGPHFWQTCAENFCNRYTWYGGISRCDFDPKEHGCGCMGLDQDECAANDRCQFKNCECMEKTDCEKLSFEQCSADDRCRVCNEGCVKKCELGPGQEVPDYVTLKLMHSTCKCELMSNEVCSKTCANED